MKNKRKIVTGAIIALAIIIAGVITTGFVIQNRKMFQIGNENLKLQNSYDELNKQLNKQKETNDSYEAVIKADNQTIANLTVENKALKDKISELKKTKNSNQKKIENTKINSNLIKKETPANVKTTVSMPHAYFDPNNLLAYSNTNYKSIEKALTGTSLEQVADVFVDAEKEYGLNALFLAGLVAQESGWGTSSRSINENNMTGYTVYSPSARGTNFNSKRDNIMVTAKLIRYKYLREGGQYYNGLDIWSVNKNYCATGGFYWANSITSISRSLVRKINS